MKAQAKAEVFEHGEVRKQAGILKNIAKVSFFRRQIYAPARVKTGFSMADNVSGIGGFQPGDAVDQACFARAGRAKNNSNAAFGQMKAELKLKCAVLQTDIHIQHVPPLAAAHMFQTAEGGCVSRNVISIRSGQACINECTVFFKSVIWQNVVAAAEQLQLRKRGRNNERESRG